MFEIKPDLTNKTILSKVSEIDLFRYYCHNFKEPGRMFISEFRKETVPSCKIDNYRGKIVFKDFGDQEGILSPFDYVMKKYHIDYFTALSVINRDFNLGLDGKEVTVEKSKNTPNPIYEQYEKIYTGKSIIRVHYKEWDKISIDYIKSYKLDYRVIEEKFKVKPIDYYWINDKQFKAANLSFAYYFGIQEGRYIYKIYQPLEKRFKWFHNFDSSIVQGLSQLPEAGEVLILNKAYKDVWCFNNYSIPAIAPGAEGWDIPDKILDDLFCRFRVIIVQYDWDYTGIKGMNKLRKRYAITPIPITNGRFGTKNYGSKDFSDFCKANNKLTIEEEIEKLKYKYL
jgi:hypothetical protein